MEYVWVSTIKNFIKDNDIFKNVPFIIKYIHMKIYLQINYGIRLINTSNKPPTRWQYNLRKKFKHPLYGKKEGKESDSQLRKYLHSMSVRRLLRAQRAPNPSCRFACLLNVPLSFVYWLGNKLKLFWVVFLKISSGIVQVQKTFQ